MAEKKDDMQSITFRVPRKLYSEYKEALMGEGKIVTYDLRRYMNDVVENNKKGKK